MADIRLFSAEEVRIIYETRMKKDFPASELRPLKSIEALMSLGNSFMLSYEESDEVLAYALFTKSDNSPFALLDYFAVSENKRGAGIGGKFMAALEGKLSSRKIFGIVIEVESPDKAKDEDDLLMRERRIAFYEKAGCKISNVRSHLFGVDYNLMYRCFADGLLADEDIEHILKDIYYTIHSPYIKSKKTYGLFAKVFARVWVEK